MVTPASTHTRILVALLTLCLGLGWVMATPGLAYASEDRVTRLDTTYAVQPDGSVQVEQRFDWRFPEPRRGIVLGIRVRERWDADPTKDVVYQVSHLAVESPTGAPTQLTETLLTNGSRHTLQVRVGDPDRPVSDLEHSYVVRYRLDGALRTFDGLPELYWDVTASDFPDIDRATVRVTSPGGITRARCLVGTRECESNATGRSASMSATQVRRGETLTIVAALDPGSVSNAEPRLEPGIDHRDERVARIGPVAVMVVMIAIGFLFGRMRVGRDRTFVGPPPGVIAPSGTPAAPVFRRRVVPVRFSPPDASPLVAGAALDRRYRSEHLAATLVDMVLDRDIRLSIDPVEVHATAIPPADAPNSGKEPPALKSTLLKLAIPVSGRQPSAPKQNQVLAMVRAASTETRRILREDLGLGSLRTRARVWAVLRTIAGPGLVLAAWLWILAEVLAPRGLSHPAMGVFAPVALFFGVRIGLFFCRPALGPKGTALREQTEGFRSYLATAEAAQLNFEADQDIYRRYLPWAVLFGLTERWTRVCQDLARQGQIPPLDDVLAARGLTGRSLSVNIAALSSAVARQSRGYGASTAGLGGRGGGSGGSSGFGGGASGGGGGGGTSARSW
ncbi:DUF2207 domain-containing protein [Ammonicoccus fulvus]|uniref:DUF2207 domain-containing protein n=1 Tax=Ammonicoccus fulvus TaxID=3138240 RepID=A0ABZ3FP70_9ACTN